MTALVECPLCGGGGIITVCANDGKCGCSHTNDREYPCHACDETGEVPEVAVNREGELITFDGCNCDLDSPCFDARCQMERDLEQRRMYALYKAGALTPPRDVWQSVIAEQLADAGRGHLARSAVWGEEPF